MASVLLHVFLDQTEEGRIVNHEYFALHTKCWGDLYSLCIP